MEKRVSDMVICNIIPKKYSGTYSTVTRIVTNQELLEDFSEDDVYSASPIKFFEMSLEYLSKHDKHIKSLELATIENYSVY